MEFQFKLQKNQIHRYFQSYQSIPNNKCMLTLEELDRKIIMESSNLFSIFELVIFIKNQQVVSGNPFRIFRRLMTLVFCIISEYQLYLSKIKTLTTFWWQTGLETSKKIKCNKSFKLLVAQSQENSFKQKCLKNEYIYHILRCFNSILQKFIVNERKDSSVSSQKRQIQQYLQKSLAHLKAAIFDQKQQNDHKMLLILQYCNFLMLTFHMRKNTTKLTYLFDQFCESINLIIRLMKKFFKPSTIQYRASLVAIIERGYKIFGDLIPDHKRKLLKIIIIYLYRKQDQKYNKIQFGDQISPGQKKSLIILSRSLNDWKLKYENKYKKSIKEIDLLSPVKKENQKIDELPKVLKARNYQESFQNINKGIGELKRKRSQSVKLKNQGDVNEFEIKFKVENQIQKQFSRLKYLKNRSYSTFNTTKQIRKNSINNHTEKEVELKLDDYKNKKWEHKNKKTFNKKLKITLRV